MHVTLYAQLPNPQAVSISRAWFSAPSAMGGGVHLWGLGLGALAPAVLLVTVGPQPNLCSGLGSVSCKGEGWGPRGPRSTGWGGGHAFLPADPTSGGALQRC